MNTTEIKKQLYKEKPIATKYFETEDEVYYSADTSGFANIKFRIPIKEADAFKNEMPAQLLIRWLVNN